MQKEKSIEAQAIEVLLLELKNIFSNSFKNGFFDCSANDTLITSGAVYLGMIGKIEDQSHRIEHNDPIHHIFKVYPHQKGFTIKRLTGSLDIQPEKGSFYAMRHISPKFNKYSGSSDKIKLKFQKYITELKQLVLENRNNLYKTDVKDVYFE